MFKIKWDDFENVSRTGEEVMKWDDSGKGSMISDDWCKGSMKDDSGKDSWIKGINDVDSEVIGEIGLMMWYNIERTVEWC